MSKAEAAIKSAPGVLAVKVDFEARQATIGTRKGQDVPVAEILAALKSIGYAGQFADQLAPERSHPPERSHLAPPR